MGPRHLRLKKKGHATKNTAISHLKGKGQAGAQDLLRWIIAQMSWKANCRFLIAQLRRTFHEFGSTFAILYSFSVHGIASIYFLSWINQIYILYTRPPSKLIKQAPPGSIMPPPLEITKLRQGLWCVLSQSLPNKPHQGLFCILLHSLKLTEKIPSGGYDASCLKAYQTSHIDG